MTPDLTRTQKLLFDLVASFTKHPEAIRVEAKEEEGAVLWVISDARQEDESILVGKQGSHVRALAFLVWCIGEARGVKHSLKLITVHEPRDRAAMVKKVGRMHTASPAVALLQRLLAELAIGEFRVEVEAGEVGELLSFVLTIQVRQFVDYNALTVAPSTAPNATETIVGALGTLFRAIAKKNGVRYDLVIERERLPVS